MTASQQEYLMEAILCLQTAINKDLEGAELKRLQIRAIERILKSEDK